MSATQMYPSLWGGFPWFNVHKDRQGASYNCCCSPYQLSSWLIYPLGKSMILVIGESPTTMKRFNYLNKFLVYKLYLNNLRLKTVFTQIEMNNEWNINFSFNFLYHSVHLFQWVFHWCKHLWNFSCVNLCQVEKNASLCKRGWWIPS